MIKEALEYLSGQAVKAHKAVPLDVDDPRSKFWLMPDGSICKQDVSPAPRNHRVNSLEDLIRFANSHDESHVETVVIWYCPGAVIAVLDDNGHRLERVEFRLNTSELFGRILRLKTERFDWRGFVRLLRIDLVGAIEPATLLNIVRSLKFENGQVIKAESKRASESMGREIVSSVSGEKDIPESVYLSIPVYSNPGETDRFPLRCSVDVDPQEGRFALIPYPDEIEIVQQLAVASIGERLETGLAEGVKAYHGAP